MGGGLLLLLPPVKVPLACEAPQAAHAVARHHLGVPGVAGVSRVLGPGHRCCHEAPGGPGLQTLVFLPENPAKRRLQSLLLCGGRSGRCSFLCKKLCGVKRVLEMRNFNISRRIMQI